MSGFIDMDRLVYGPWPALERAVARFAEHYGFDDVRHVGGSGDRGADVVASRKGKLYVFQAKHLKSGQIGPGAIDEVVRALAAYKADIGVVVTNQSFTKTAQQRRDELKQHGIRIALWGYNRMLRNFDEKLEVVSAARHQLRPYQEEAVDCVEAKRGSGADRALVLMATGLGKSLVAGELVANELARNPTGEVLVLAHTTPLMYQLERSLWPCLPKHVPTHIWGDSEKPAYVGGVTVGMWQTLIGAIKRENLAGRFSLVIVDEAHRAPAPQYRSLVENLLPNFLVGMTATPWRGDKLPLDEPFGKPTYVMDLVEGMQQGYLADVEYRMKSDDVDWEEIAQLSKAGYSKKQLNKKLFLPDRDEAIVRSVIADLEAIESPRTIGFCRSIKHAEAMHRLFAAYGLPSVVIHGKLPKEERDHVLVRFRSGDAATILAVEMLNEGIDIPDANVILFLRVTHSRRIFVQQLGRGLRVTPEKQSVTVLDYVADLDRLLDAERLNSQARTGA
tara:strand:+ start:877 stop:2388 length:1512 start_codon:yes stop_codon:yes gene_type:complete